MQKKILSIGLVLSLFLVLSQNQIWASGNLTTNQDQQPGQTKIVSDENGAMYLTTETNPGASTNSTKSRQNYLSAPDGFATDIGQLINSVLSFVMVIAALLAFLYLIWGAFEWITSGGDKGKIDSARQKLIAAVIGLIIVSASYAILLIAINFLGFTDLNDVFNEAQNIRGSQLLDLKSPAASSSATPSPSPNSSPAVTPTPMPTATPSPTPSPSSYSNSLRELFN